MADDVETKLSAARTRLILDKPFLGALTLRLPVIAANPEWCKTTATDARAFYYNPEFIKALSLDETQFILAHEALHCALSHFARRQGRVKHRWDLACDYAINPLLIDEGLKPPPGSLFLQEFADMTAEEIYPCLQNNDESETLDQHVYDQASEQGQGENSNNPEEATKPDPDRSGKGKGGQGNTTPQDEHDQEQGSGAAPKAANRGAGAGEGEKGAPQPAPLTSQERDALSVQWQQRMAGAAQQAMQAGKLGGAMARLVDHLLQPQLPWRMLLARYMTAIARDDYSFTRPSKREGAAILPSLRSTQVEVVTVIDSSGSISAEEINAFLTEVDAIKGQLRARITLLACDTELAEGCPWVCEPWEELKLPKELTGGGGTSFVPPFRWIESQDRQPDLLLYFTDADGEFPQVEPPYPVLWLVKGKAKVPWGQRLQLN